MSVQKSNWEVVSRVVRGAIILAFLGILAPEVWQGAIGLTSKTGMNATITRSDHPVVFWVLTGGMTFFLLTALYRVVFESNPDA